ncbi:aminotransferase DegT [Helicobacter valdiviensis]|uniref:Aminotransferase DegT n=1 Tax=Helicobacter valdiviensis TaxID=1458358 RepID=A0A2W6MSD5_9HELI|nr:DegT/DnrJ/EryC1/StrS aminotransferase family protein [Helicobacter valdiviensis]PZT47454.1 aminotransferase DegT [Helicobacter valdiviensis]
MRNIPYFIPDITEVEQEAIHKVLEHPSYNLVPQFEESFKKYIGIDHAISTNSGTSAFHLCLFAMDLKRGDKIICSVNCHPMFPQMIRHFDAEPIFVDIDEDTFMLSLQKCKEAIEANPSKKLRAIILSHTAGQACELEPFLELAKSHQLKIIEDATMALGLSYKGKRIGSNKEIYASIFSVVLDSPMPVAQAGFLATSDEELAKRAILLRYHGIVSEKVTSVRPQYLYDVVGLGNKYNLSMLDVALCASQLDRMDYIVTKRKSLAEFYHKELKSIPHISPPIVRNEHIYCHFIIKVEKNRDDFAKEMKNEGIETGLHFVPLHLLSYYKSKYKLKVNDFPIALKNYQQILSLPIYSAMKEEDLEYVIDTIKNIIRKRG